MISSPLLLYNFKSITSILLLYHYLTDCLSFFFSLLNSQPYKITIQTMIDPLSVTGVVYPIACNLVALVKKLKRVYKGVRYAKKDLIKVMRRTNIVARTYDFFNETMENVRRIQELASIYARHGELIGTVESESEKIIKRLEHITEIFWLQINKKPVNTVDKWIVQFEWYRQSKEAVPSLFQDMKVLERSMKTIASLVNTQILLQAYERDGSNLILSQM